MKRSERMRAIAAAHDEWVDRWEPRTQPETPIEGPSQYPETYVDLDAGPTADAEFMRAVANL